ncbi:tRNA pseudouridine(13) synthase TruD [Haloparvum sp. PAK95]|uniref:tRNA pseudouridine(13) synthase TruD n=1 Tax=Haloparvum sp. PAK95 TaxID=3418962 RepID=UPI003D2EB703
MRSAHPIEDAVGIEYYVSDADGIDGQLRVDPSDFRVRELEQFETEPVDADPGPYPELVCRVRLENWDTNDFVRRLSDALGISRERVSWAGTKDKRAITTQLITIEGIDPEDLPEIRGADIDVVGRAGRPLTFGDLAGNAFEICVRDAVDDAPERAERIAADLRDFAGAGDDDSVGVPNYFGQQRFGSRRPVTHAVGLAALRGDWRGAVRAYVGNPYETEPEATQEARDLVEAEFDTDDPDWEACLDAMPNALRFERSMLHRLQETGAETDADWRNALEAVPSNLQRMFVNAAQSYVFNRILSERLERGLPFDRPVAGDVACFADGDAPAELYAPDTDRLQRVSEERVRVMERHCERGKAFVTAPLVGTETELADGEPGEIEREVVDEVGIEPSDFDLPGDFGSTGTRRAILLRTDLEVDDDLWFEFALPSGSYATVLLREFLKSGPLEL